MLRALILCLTAATIMLLVAVAHAEMSIDVSPLRFELREDPGDESTHSVQVQNSGTVPIRMKAYVEDWEMDLEGTPLFRTAGTLVRSASRWIEASPNDFLLEPGQIEYVRFTMRVPVGAAVGAYWCGLLLESVPLQYDQEHARHMLVKGRVASMVYVTVGDPYRAAEIASLSTVTREGRSYLRLEVANTGQDVIRLAGKVNGIGGTDGFEEERPLPDVPVLPGTRRIVEMELTERDLAKASVAQVAIDLAGVGRLLGTCPIAAGGREAVVNR
jgi:P pilus assembly chaperone PapD